MPRYSSTLLLFAALGCGGDPQPEAADGGVVGIDGAVTFAQLPEPPAAPVLTPCPDGWHESVADGVTHCEPWDTAEPEACGPGQARFPGEAACATVGNPCPGGDYSALLPTDRPVIRVLAGATAGGDGTVGAPYASLHDFSLGSLPAGAVIALGVGTYEGGIRLPSSLTLWGACVEQTRVQLPSDPAGDPVLGIRGTAVELRDLTVGPGIGFGVQAVAGDTEAHLEGVAVEGARTAGLVIQTGSWTARDLVVRGTTNDGASRLSGAGISLVAGAAFDGTRVAFLDNPSGGVIAQMDGDTLRLRDSTIRNPAGGTPDLAESYGIYFSSPDGTAVVERTAIRNVDRSGFLTVGGTGQLSDVVIRRGLGSISGRGIDLEAGATVRGERVLLDQTHDAAAIVFDPGTTLELDDTLILDTQPLSGDGTYGRGLTVQLGGNAQLTRVVVRRAHEVGVLVTDRGSSATLEDVLIGETQPETATMGLGHGMALQFGATAIARRLSVEGSRDVGIQVTDEMTTFGAEDLAIRGTRESERDRTAGRGLNVQLGATADFVRSLIEDNRELGVLAIAPGTRLTMRDATIRGTRAAECDSPDCAGPGIGSGAVAAWDAALEVVDFEIRDSQLCGVFVVDGGGLDLSSGRIASNAIGACVQVDGYDLSRLRQAVEYADNAVSLDATSLPVPAVVDPLL